MTYMVVKKYNIHVIHYMYMYTYEYLERDLIFTGCSSLSYVKANNVR